MVVDAEDEDGFEEVGVGVRKVDDGTCIWKGDKEKLQGG